MFAVLCEEKYVGTRGGRDPFSRGTFFEPVQSRRSDTFLCCYEKPPRLPPQAARRRKSDARVGKTRTTVVLRVGSTIRTRQNFREDELRGHESRERDRNVLSDYRASYDTPTARLCVVAVLSFPLLKCYFRFLFGMNSMIFERSKARCCVSRHYQQVGNNTYVRPVQLHQSSMPATPFSGRSGELLGEGGSCRPISSARLFGRRINSRSGHLRRTSSILARNVC